MAYYDGGCDLPAKPAREPTLSEDLAKARSNHKALHRIARKWAAEETLDGRGGIIEALLRTIELDRESKPDTLGEACFGIGLVHWYNARYQLAAGDFHAAAGHFGSAARAADTAERKSKPRLKTPIHQAQGATDQAQGAVAPDDLDDAPSNTGDEFRLDQLRAVANEALAWSRAGLTGEEVRIRLAPMPGSLHGHEKDHEKYLRALIAYAWDDAKAAERAWRDLVGAIPAKTKGTKVTDVAPEIDPLVKKAAISLVGLLIENNEAREARKYWNAFVQPEADGAE